MVSSHKLLEDYTLGEVLGQGAFGVVYECTLKGRDEYDFAVKMVDKVESPIVEIKREAEIIQALSHPNVVTFHAIYFEKVFVCIVMDGFKGGDMIEGMQDHWKERGKIPCRNINGAVRQMIAALDHLHGRLVVHRDIKGDNYLMDRKDIVDPATRIILTDFGTAAKFIPDQRMNQSVGTKIYWSPEFYSLNYGPKVDLFAVGIIMYGLIEGRFPFKGERDCKNKAVKAAGATPLASDLLMKLLAKKDTDRCSAADALKMEFIASAGPAEAKTDTAEEDKTWRPETVKEGVNAGMDERRKELVSRLENAQKAGGTKEDTRWKLKEIWRDRFELGVQTGKKAIKRITCGWLTPAQIAEMNIVRGGEVSKTEEKPDTEGVKKNLQDHRIDVSKWGTGEAKTIEEFAGEVHSGAALLMLDASDYKKMVRVVDTVLLRLSCGTGATRRFVVEKSEVYADGRSRDLNRLPGTKKEPHENSRRTAARVLKDALGITNPKFVTFSEAKEVFEEEMTSVSFPGVTTVYRKEIISGSVDSSDIASMEKLGLKDFAKSKTDPEYKNGGKVYAWCLEKTCEDKRIKLRAPAAGSEASALVQAPIGLKLEDLEKFLSENNVDPEAFGRAETANLKAFSDELIRGESTLVKSADGKLRRVVDVVLLKLIKEGSGEVLVEMEEQLDGAKNTLNRLPGSKHRADENHFLTAQRIFKRQLWLDENYVDIDASNVTILEETKDSVSYPGLPTLYRKRIIVATLMSPDKV
jgi:serine/threonine protein kinase